MKVHEEEGWRAAGVDVVCVAPRVTLDAWCTRTLHPDNRPGALEARARLMAAAPDMARVLLAVEWSDHDEEGSKCPSCGAPEYVPPARYDAAGEYIGYTEGTHEADCALKAAIEKAGLR